MKIFENVSIAELTTMRLGGKAKFVAEIRIPEEIAEAYKFAHEKNLKVFILGRGANSIGRDEGFDGLILVDKIKGIEIVGETHDEMFVRGMGGEIWDDVVKFTTDRNLSGIEALTKIPGTLGAAPVQNIGAYGQDIAQVLENVEAYDSKLDKFVTITRDEFEFEYRKSIFNSGKMKDRFFIFAVCLRLRKDKNLEPPFYTSLQNYVDKNKVTDFSPKNIRKMVAKIRAEKLPDPEKIASSGSFFKNVYLDDKEADKAEEKGIKVWRDGKTNKVNTGWLIQEAGLAGKELYGMRVSEKAALVLINESAKSYKDLNEARTEIKKVIKEKFGFVIEQEPVEII